MESADNGPASRKQPARVIAIALFIPYLLPILFIAGLILTYAVDVPYWDQWDNEVVIFNSVTEGRSLTLSRLTGFHNESRPLIPRLVWRACAAFSPWDFRYNLFAAFALACCTALCLLIIVKRLVTSRPIDVAVVMTAANILIFSAAQYENWLWGFQFIQYIPPACLAAGLVAATSRASADLRYIICALLCLTATWSFVSGLFIWLPLLPVLLLFTSRSAARPWAGLGIYLSVMALTFFFYFRDYQAPENIASTWDPLVAAQNFFMLLGNSLSAALPENGGSLGLISGVCLFILFVAAFLYAAWPGRDVEFRRQSAPWLAAASYTLMCAVAVSVGRGSMGADEAVPSKYATFSLYLPLGLLFLGLVFRKNVVRRMVRMAIVVCGAAIVVGGLAANGAGVKGFGLFGTYLEKGRIVLCFAEIMPREPLRLLYPTIDVVAERGPKLGRSGRLRAHMLRKADMSLIEIKIPAPIQRGAIMSTKKVGGSFHVVTGTAMAPYRIAPPDAIILAYNDDEGRCVAFDYTIGPYYDPSNANTPITDVAHRGPVVWIHRFSAASLPKRSTEITAWAFDATTGKASRLEGSVRLGGAASK